MKREDAINYLQRKGKIRKPKKVIEEKIVKVPKKKKVVEYIDPKFNKKEEKEIEEVMKEGRIYGDPVAEIQW